MNGEAQGVAGPPSSEQAKLTGRFAAKAIARLADVGHRRRVDEADFRRQGDFVDRRVGVDEAGADDVVVAEGADRSRGGGEAGADLRRRGGRVGLPGEGDDRRRVRRRGGGAAEVEAGQAFDRDEEAWC